MIKEVETAMTPILNEFLYTPLLESTKKLVDKCNFLKLGGGGGDWKLDPQYKTSRATISADGLEYGIAS